MADLRSYVVGVAIADNLATPSNDTQAVATFNMVYDGSNWDMARGDSTDGLLVNLGSNNDVDTELAAAAALTDDFANPTTAPVGAFLMVWDSATWDRAPGTSADGLLVNLGTNNDVTVTSGNITADTELPAAAALADDTANPTVPGVGAFLMGYDSSNTNWNRAEVDDAGHLQVDVLSGGGTDSPTTPATDYVTSASLAAGAEVDLDTADVGTQELWAFQVWCSAAYKCLLYTVENSVESAEPLVVGGGRAHESFQWSAPHRDFVSITSSGGNDLFRVTITNLDDSNAADVYATFQYSAS